MHSFTIAATLVAAATSALAAGITVNNLCAVDVYLMSVGDATGPVTTLKASGGTYSETYQVRASGGVSIKIKPNNDFYDGGYVLQAEYTVPPSGEWASIWYDISYVNGNPFLGNSVHFYPTTNNGTGSCENLYCPADPTGSTPCKNAYSVWNDDFATHDCPQGTDLVFDLCGSETSSATPTTSATPVATTTTKAAASKTATAVHHHTTIVTSVIAQAVAVQTTAAAAPAAAVAVAAPAPAAAAAAPASHGWALAVDSTGAVSEVEMKHKHKRTHEHLRRMHAARAMR